MNFDIEKFWDWIRSLSILVAVFVINGFFFVLYILVMIALGWYFKHH